MGAPPSPPSRALFACSHSPYPLAESLIESSRPHPYCLSRYGLSGGLEAADIEDAACQAAPSFNKQQPTTAAVS